jgi:ubiquinone/menaquinone biosynthesis C-methylase UbiE
MTINQQQLDHYFSKIWAQQNLDNLDTYIYTGWKLVDKIQDGERVLDVGCGQNHFKNHS